MRRIGRFLFGVLTYLVWPAAAAVYAYGRTDALFREKLVPLPFEAFGWLVAAGTFCFALSASVLFVGLWKSRRGKNHENQNGSSARLSGARPVDARVGG